MSPKLKAKILSYTPALFWGFLISILTLMPQSKIPRELADMNDKLIHGGIYFLTALLIIFASLRYNFKNVLTRARMMTIWLFCVSFGGVIELLQANLVPGRHGDWLDFLANSFGALLAVLLWFIYQSRKAWLIDRSKKRTQTPLVWKSKKTGKRILRIIEAFSFWAE